MKKTILSTLFLLLLCVGYSQASSLVVCTGGVCTEPGGGGGSSLTVQDEGGTLAGTILNFVGAGVACTASAGTISCNITGAAGAAYGTIQDEGTARTQRNTINFIGANISCVDNAGAAKTDCTVSGEVPITFSTGLTRATNTVTVNTTQNITNLSNLGTNGFVRTSGSNGTLSVDTGTYLTANQTITLSGHVTGTGTTSIITTIPSSTITAAMLASKSGTGTIIATVSGVINGNKCLEADSNGNIVIAAINAACGSGGGGGGSSVGGTNAIQASNGSGGFLNSGCSAVASVMTCTGGFVSGDGTTVGNVTMSELSASGANFRRFDVVSALTADLTLRFPDAVPAAGDVITLSAPATNVSTISFTGSSGTGNFCRVTGCAISLTAATGLPIGSVTGLGTNVATWLATPSGANLASALTTALPNTKGGTGIDSSGSTGMVKVSAGAWSVSTLAAGDITNATITPAKLTTAANIRTCSIVINGSGASGVLQNGDMSTVTDGENCFVPAAATLVEVTVRADAGTPNIIARRIRLGTAVNLTSAALATAASGAQACSRTGGGTGLDGSTGCSSTLQNTSFNAGDWLGVTSGTAGGTAKRISLAISYTVN